MKKLKLKKRHEEETDEEEVEEEKEEKDDDDGDDEKDVAKAATKGDWFSKGYEPVHKHKAEIEKGGKGKFALNFWVAEDESASVRFISNDPVNIKQHSLKIGGRFQTRTCLMGTGEKCPYCASGNKPRFVGVYSIIDRRKNEWVDSGGKQHKERNQVKMWACGHRILSMLERLIAKCGKLSEYDIEVTRSGGGKDTVYNLIPDAPEEMSEDDQKKTKLNLIEVLAPKSRAEALAEIGGKDDEKDEEEIDV